MKKFVAVLLIALLSLGAVALAEESAAVANPWTECDAQTMLDTLGFAINLPEDAENATYRMNTELSLAEVDFTWQDMAYTARMQPTDAFEDISGLYYVWAYEEAIEIGGCEGSILRGYDEGLTIDLCLFYDVVPGLMYSVSASGEDLDGFDITAAAQAIYAPVQTEA